MKKYSEFKPSGIEWIGDIPKEWNTIKLKWLTPIKRGASPRPIDDLKYFDEDGEFAWVRIADVTASERYLVQTTEKLSELGSSLSVKRYPGDFFVSIAGSVGKPIITKIKCCIHDGFVWFPELKINPEYLYYIFQTRLPFIGLGKLGTQLNLNTETIGNISIPNLSNEYIDNIVKYLDHQTAIIDQLILQKEKMIELLKEKKQAVINETVTKGLNPGVKMKDSGIEWLKEIPEHWKYIKLKWVSEIYAGGTPSTNIDEFWQNGTIPWLNSGSVNQKRINKASDFITEEAVIKSSTKWVPKGAILMALAGQGKTKGMVAVLDIDATCNQSTAAIVPESIINNEYLYFWLHINYQRIRGLAGNEQRDGLNLQIIGDIFCPIPPIDTQNEIVDYINTIDLKTDSSVKLIEIEIEKLKEYRQSIISEAVTGKIDVRDWQNNKKELA